IGLLAALEHDLLLQQPRAVAQLDDLGVEPIEPLKKLLRPQIEGRILGLLDFVLETLDERAERDQLPMHAYGRAPHAADHLAVDIELIGQDPFLGKVELIGKAVGKMVERLDHLPGNQFEQDGRRLNLGTETKRLAGGFDSVQLMPAAGDEYFLG